MATASVAADDQLAQNPFDFGTEQAATVKLDYSSSSIEVDLGSSDNAVKKI